LLNPREHQYFEWLNINGILSDTVNYNGALTTTTNDLVIGNNLNTSRAFDGKIDEVNIWSVARTQSEIQFDMYHTLEGTETGIVSYWQFNESSGSTVTDAVGVSNGTLNNMSDGDWVESTMLFDSNDSPDVVQGNCLDFDGVDDYVLIADDNSLDLTTYYTIEAWVKPTSFNWLTGIVSKYNSTTTTGYTLRSSTSAPYTGLNFDGMVSADDILTAGEWTHIAAVNDNGTRRLYIDGIEEALTGTAIVTLSNSDPVTIGVDYLALPRFFDGKIDEVRIWNSARTEAQIQSNMNNALDGTEADLVGYWQLNEDSVNLAKDNKANNYGLLQNMTADDWVASGIPFGTPTSGTISVDTIWSDDLITVIGDITVSPGVTLTINPGTTVFFSGSYSITIEGRLLAIGTESNMISFTSSVNTHWKSLMFLPDNLDFTSELEYCILENAYLDNNEPGRVGGGAIYVDTDLDYYEISVKNCNFRNNRAEKGGAIFSLSCRGSYSGNTFTGNSADFGGAFYLDSGDENQIVHSVFSDNYATQKGGALYVDDSQLVVSNLFYNNESNLGPGGAIYSASYGTDYICNTITGNIAPTGAGMAFENDNSDVGNCIIYGNIATDGSQINLSVVNRDPLFTHCNIEGGVAAFSGDTASFYSYYDCKDADPQFTDSVNNDYTLQPNSSCINSGSVDTTFEEGYWLMGDYRDDSLDWDLDLAGNSRFFDAIETGNTDLNDCLDACDMGSYEYIGNTGIIGSNHYTDGDAVIPTDIHIAEGVRFSIGTGDWRFQNGSSLYIHGNLQAGEALGSWVEWTRFLPYDEYSDFGGLVFSSANASASSKLGRCIIEGGLANTSNESEYGGNISIYGYNEVVIDNCIIRNGEGYNGGGIYVKYSGVEIRGTVLNDNDGSNMGGALFSYNSGVKISNCTIAENTSGSSGNALRFESYTNEPQITNSIIWDNGSSPVYPTGHTLTNVSYCDLEYNISGSGNISLDPQFKVVGAHPFEITGGSHLINAGIADTTGLHLADYDMLGNPQIFQHTTSSYNRKDIGAYEVQGILGPSPFEASDGNNDYHGYIRLDWDYVNPDPIRHPTPTHFRILRDGAIINTIDASTFYYHDDTPTPSVIYNYTIQTMADSQFGNSAENSGFIRPNGIVTGTVLSTNGNPVAGVKVYLDPSIGTCLEFDSSNSSNFITEDLEVRMDSTYTIEFWVKTAQSNGILLSKGIHNFRVNASNNLEYSDGTTSLEQTTGNTINDNSWHHIAFVNDLENTTTILYIDGEEAAINTNSVIGVSSSDGFSNSMSFTGFLDEIKLWTIARDSIDIYEQRGISASIEPK